MWILLGIIVILRFYLVQNEKKPSSWHDKDVVSAFKKISTELFRPGVQQVILECNSTGFTVLTNELDGKKIAYVFTKKCLYADLITLLKEKSCWLDKSNHSFNKEKTLFNETSVPFVFNEGCLSVRILAKRELANSDSAWVLSRWKD